MFELKKIELGKQDLSPFFEVPFALDPENHSKEQEEIERNQLSPKNLFFEHAEGCAFIILKDGKFKGRIFASLDHNLVQKQGEKVGHIGYVCFSHGPEYRQLVIEAENWLKEKGATHVHGPMNLNIINGYRLQVSGFKTKPFPGEPRNPSQYKDLLKSLGYKVINTWNSWDLPPEFIKLSTDYAKQICQNKSLEGIKIRPINVEKFEEELAAIYECALESFSLNYGISKISREEFVQSLLHLKPLMADEFFHILEEENGQISGFIMGYKDSPTDPSRIIFHTIAIKQHWQKTHAPYLISIPMGDAVAQTGRPGIGALAKEGKSTYDRLGPPTRSYSMFSKNL